MQLLSWFLMGKLDGFATENRQAFLNAPIETCAKVVSHGKPLLFMIRKISSIAFFRYGVLAVKIKGT